MKLLTYLVAIFILQEVVFRVFFPLPELSNFDRINYGVQNPKSRSQAHLRDIDWYWSSLPDTAHRFVHEMNRYGFRDEEWSIAKPENKKRILLVGDSFVEGIMAEQNQTIKDGFLSADDHAFEVLNAGMMGVGVDSYSQFIADAVPIFNPDYVILFIYTNDLGKRVPSIPQFFLEPEQYALWKPRLLEVVQQAVAGNSVLARWTSEVRNYLPSVPARNNPWSRNAEELDGQVRPDLAEHMKNGAFNPFRVNQFLRMEDFLKTPLNFGETLPFLQYFTKEHGAKLIICYIPSRDLVTDHYYQFERAVCQEACPENMSLNAPEYHEHRNTLRQNCLEYKIDFIDLTDTVQEQEKSGNHLYWNYDDHMRGKGYVFLGEQVYKNFLDITP